MGSLVDHCPDSIHSGLFLGVGSRSWCLVPGHLSGHVDPWFIMGVGDFRDHGRDVLKERSYLDRSWCSGNRSGLNSTRVSVEVVGSLDCPLLKLYGFLSRHF